MKEKKLAGLRGKKTSSTVGRDTKHGDTNRNDDFGVIGADGDSRNWDWSQSDDSDLATLRLEEEGFKSRSRIPEIRAWYCLEEEGFNSDLVLQGDQESQKNALIKLMATFFSGPTIQDRFDYGTDIAAELQEQIVGIELGPNGINVTVTPDFEGFYKGLNPKEQTAIQDAIREQFNSLHKEGVKQYKDTHKEHGGVDDIYKAAKSFDRTLKRSSRFNPISSKHEDLVGAELGQIAELEATLKADQEKMDSLGKKFDKLQQKVEKAVENDATMRNTGLSERFVKEQIKEAIRDNPELSAERRTYEGIKREHDAIKLEGQELVAKEKSIALSKIELNAQQEKLAEQNQNLDKGIGALVNAGMMPRSTSLLTKLENELANTGMDREGLVRDLKTNLTTLKDMNHQERQGEALGEAFNGLTKSLALIEVLATEKGVGKKVQSMAKEVTAQLKQITTDAVEVVKLEKDIDKRTEQTQAQEEVYQAKRNNFNERVKDFSEKLDNLSINNIRQRVGDIKAAVLDKVTEALDAKKDQIAQKVENALGAPDGADVADRQGGGMNQNIDKNLQALKAALKQDPEAADALNNKGTKMDNKYGNARPTNAADPARTTGDNDRNL